MTILEFQRFRSLEGEKKVTELAKKDAIFFGIDVVDHDIIEAAFVPNDAASISETLLKSFGELDSQIRVKFQDTVLEDDKVAKVPILEHVVNIFPAKSVTAELKRKIEDEFSQFDTVNMRNPNRLFCETGWSLEFDSPDSTLGQAIAFVVIAGWNSMELFQEHMQREDFQRALPIVANWKVPVKMVGLDPPYLIDVLIRCSGILEE